MNRRLWLVVAGGTAVAVVVAASCLPGPTGDPGPTPRVEPTPVLCSHLPRLVFERGEYRGRVVRVSFEMPLTPTADPLVWEYRPGRPADITPPSYRIVFDRPPAFGPKMPVAVVGTVTGIAPDSRVRPDRVPGAVVLTAAFVDPPALP